MMANLSERLPENALGKFYVDTQCIDCQLCQDLAPRNFACNVNEERHFVVRQPASDQELEAVLDAMESCPTSAIGDNGDELAGTHVTDDMKP